jgi:hypothetical protein
MWPDLLLTWYAEEEIMRSLALTALFGSFMVSTSLHGQSLTEHAAAAAGATIGTAAGKPLGTALGRVFGEVDQTTSNAAGPKTLKPVPAKPAPVPAPVATSGAAPAAGEHPVAASGGGGGEEGFAGGTGGSSETVSPSRHASRRRTLPLGPAPEENAPIAAVVAEPVKQPSVEDIASVKVGASSSDLRETLGTAESTVSIPGDDGHLLEIRQYWAKGEPVGTIRLDNGRVVSVQPTN